MPLGTNSSITHNSESILNLSTNKKGVVSLELPELHNKFKMRESPKHKVLTSSKAPHINVMAAPPGSITIKLNQAAGQPLLALQPTSSKNKTLLPNNKSLSNILSTGSLLSSQVQLSQPFQMHNLVSAPWAPQKNFNSSNELQRLDSQHSIWNVNPHGNATDFTGSKVVQEIIPTSVLLSQ